MSEVFRRHKNYCHLEEIGQNGDYIGLSINPYIESRLALAYPGEFPFNGHRYNLVGHQISELDERVTKQMGGSLLYGEVLIQGVTKLCDEKHMDIKNAKIVYDFGAGTGKLAVQCFFEYPHLERVVAVEISPSRFKMAAEAWRRLALLKGFALIADNDFECILIQTSGNRRRILEFKCCDVFDSLDPNSRLANGDKGYVQSADIIFLNTDFPDICTPNLCKLFRTMRVGARCASYSDVRIPYTRHMKQTNAPSNISKFPLVNTNVVGDRFATSWTPDIGHHFFCWVRR